MRLQKPRVGQGEALPWAPRARSSAGQSSRLIIGRSLVRVQAGPNQTQEPCGLPQPCGAGRAICARSARPCRPRCRPRGRASSERRDVRAEADRDPSTTRRRAKQPPGVEDWNRVTVAALATLIDDLRRLAPQCATRPSNGMTRESSSQRSIASSRHTRVLGTDHLVLGCWTLSCLARDIQRRIRRIRPPGFFKLPMIISQTPQSQAANQWADARGPAAFAGWREP